MRVSSIGQKSGDGFPRQQEAIERYAAQNGHEIADLFFDSVTGTSDFDEREGFSMMISYLERSKVELVLVERPDRLARDLMVSEILLADLRKRGVQVIAAESGMDLSVFDNDPSRTLIRQIFGAIAQWEKSCLVAKLRAARRRKGDDGGIRPYGFYIEEQDGAEMIDTLMAQGCSLRGVKAGLEEAGFMNRNGKPWDIRSIQRIVRARGWRPKRKPRRWVRLQQ